MMSRLKILTALFAVVMLTAGADVAKANTIQYSATPIGLTLTDWGTPTPLNLTFQQFNSATYGTLNSVTLEFQSGLTTTLTVVNNGSSPSSGNVKTEVQVIVQDAGNNLVNTPQLDYNSPAFAYSNLSNISPNNTLTSGLLSKTSPLSDDVYTTTAILNEFTGAGTYSLLADTFTQTLLANSGGNTTPSQITDASLSGIVIYDYTPITPEPATMGLLGLGLAALVARRKRAGK